MENKSIALLDWKQSEVSNLDCLYGYSYKSQCYYPFKEINEVKNIGKTGRVGVKGFAENGDKLYIQLYKEHINKAIEKNWIVL